MTLFLSPIIGIIPAMDRKGLEQARLDNKASIGRTRRHFWLLWCRNRLACGLALILYLILLAGAMNLLPWESARSSGLSLLIAAIVSLAVTLFFISHTPMNTFIERLYDEETASKDQLNMHLYIRNAIGRRHREL